MINKSIALATKWADAFVDRDAAALIELAGDEVRQQLTGEGLLDEEVPYFGWSSPWPMFTEKRYEINSSGANARKAEIIYYATNLDSERNIRHRICYLNELMRTKDSWQFSLPAIVL